MKKIAALLASFLMTITIFSQSETEILDKARSLVGERKYESAFKVLQSFDPNNKVPGIVLLKEEIVLNYAIYNKNNEYREFIVPDLKPGEGIDDNRDPGEGRKIYFPLIIIFNDLVKQHPDNCKLHEGLAYAYYNVILSMGDEIADNPEVYQDFLSSAQKAYDGKCSGYLINFLMGYIKTNEKKYTEAISFLDKSVSLNKQYFPAHLQLAIVNYYANDDQRSLQHGKNAFEIASRRNYKAKAAFILGLIYNDKLKDQKNALLNFELADKLSPKNDLYMEGLLDLYVSTNNTKATDLTNAYIGVDKTRVSSYETVISIYLKYKKMKELVPVLNDIMSSPANQSPIVQANLNYALGVVYFESNKKLSKEYLQKAKALGKEVYDEDFLQELDEAIMETEK